MTPKFRGTALLGACSLAFVTSQCAPPETVVATLPAPSTSEPCASNRDCGADSFCEKPTCAATLGVCQRRPIVCSSATAPACGCDGVSYWNDCLRQQSGVAASADGECRRDAARCGGPAHEVCPTPRSFCAAFVDQGNACSAPPPGICWGLPPECPAPPFVPGDATHGPPPGAQLWVSCNDPGRCLDVCAAIRNGPAFPAPPQHPCR